MQNIEIKAKYPDLQAAESIACQIGARPAGTLHQIDTYFRTENGRLKLREINSEHFELIFYARPDATEARVSDYQIYKVDDPSALKHLLGSALGSWCVVEKRRKLYLYDEVRIHLDSVINLGNFIEFEGVLTSASIEREVRARVDSLVRHFGVSPRDVVAGSYSDLLANASRNERCRPT